MVLDASPMKRQAELASFLQVAAAGNAEAVLLARIARQAESGISLPTLIAETGMTHKKIEECVSQKLREGIVVRIGDSFVHAPSLERLKADVIRSVEQFHNQNPLIPGINREQLREQRSIPAEIFTAALDTLVKQKKLDIAGDVVRLPGRGVVMKDEESESKKKIEEAFAAAGLKVPALNDVLAGLKVDKVRAQKIVTLLLRDKVLIKISEELLFHHTALRELRRLLALQKEKSPKMDVATFKELTGVSRKYAIPLLEYLDRERVTKRVGDAREIL